MARFNMELRSDTHVWERHPLSACCVVEARIETAIALADLLKSHAEQIWRNECWRVDITDSDGCILYAVHIKVEEAAAIMSTSVVPPERADLTLWAVPTTPSRRPLP
ncbi:DUF6894 family protein [Sphingomonas sp. BK580]|uniref:DUF6894 family protein n=1 Tax=Sphingomonas sp. BK580 TaxID=2586972 RepID=UPI0039067089